MAHPQVDILGVNVHAINMSAAVEAIAGALAKDARGYVCVTGVHGIMEARKDPALQEILNSAFLNVPDGMPTVWVGRLQGHKQMDRVYGPDLMLEVCRLSLEKGWTHFLYGGNEGVADQLKQALESRFPGIRIAGTYTPPFRPLSDTEESELGTRLHELRPDIMWIGLSTPKQERFMADHAGKLPVKLMFGVGAAFDVHTGRIKDAPRWIKRAGLQWLHRLFQEPHRLWRRYLLNNPAFIILLITHYLLGIIVRNAGKDSR